MTAEAEEKITLTDDDIKGFEEHEKQFLSSDYLEYQSKISKQEEQSPEEEKKEEVTETAESKEEEVKETPQEETPVEQTESVSNEEQETESVQEEQKTQKEIDWEKRFKDTQAQYTRSQQELAEYRKSVAQRDKLLNRFDNRIKRDEFGNPIDWDFSDTQEKQREIPQPPDEDLWIENPKEAAEKLADYRDYLRDQKEAKRERERAEKEQAEVYQRAWEESDKKAVEEYPELLNQNSEIFKEVVSIVEAHPEFQNMPDAPYVIAELAAARIGKRSQSNVNQETTIEDNKPKVKVTTKPIKMMSVGKGGSPTSASSHSKPDWLTQYEAETAKFRVS